MKDSVRIKERNIWYTTKFSFHTPDGVFVFHDGFKSALLTLKPVGVLVILLTLLADKFNAVAIFLMLIPCLLSSITWASIAFWYCSLFRCKCAASKS